MNLFFYFSGWQPVNPSGLGQRNAYLKTVYEISTDRKDWVLLKKYGDDMIMKDYDPETNKLGDSLWVVKISPTNNLKFTSKKIDALHPESNDNQ